jgi:hypothetical protein
MREKKLSEVTSTLYGNLKSDTMSDIEKSCSSSKAAFHLALPISINDGMTQFQITPH